eukprot:752636-Hanusia_phi.AAC.3
MPQPSAPEFVPVPRGNPTSSSVLCANCKSPLAPNHKFCSECGEPSHSEGPSNTPPLNYAETVQSSTFSVQIPVGVQDGQTLKVHVPPGYPQCGQTVYFSVPAGVSPGQTVQVPLPSKSGSIEYFQARVPQSCLPGQVMQVRVPQGYRNAGELVHFTIPSGTGPNQVVKVPLPAAPSQPSTGKFKVCLPLNCSPGQVSFSRVCLDEAARDDVGLSEVEGSSTGRISAIWPRCYFFGMLCPPSPLPRTMTGSFKTGSSGCHARFGCACSSSCSKEAWRVRLTLNEVRLRMIEVTSFDECFDWIYS